MNTKPADEASDTRERYYQRLADEQLAPLWVFFHDWFTPMPRVRSQPHRWRYRALRELILESARIIDPAEAERRVLVLENPGLAGRRLITESLYAGLQLIMPGELAPSHRHTPAALRFVLEGAGAYTAVNGRRAYMAPGDFIVTPPWSWHEHGHEGDGPTVWLDVLDVAMLHLFNATFTELDPDGRHARDAAAAPTFHYPYAQAKQALDRLRGRSQADPCHGHRMEYLDSATGGPAIPTISTFLQSLPQDFQTQPYRSTAGTIFCVVEGTGTVDVGGDESALSIAYAPWDVVVVPSWTPYAIRATTETTVFSASDQAAQQKLGIWREERVPVGE